MDNELRSVLEKAFGQTRRAVTENVFAGTLISLAAALLFIAVVVYIVY